VICQAVGLSMKMTYGDLPASKTNSQDPDAMHSSTNKLSVGELLIWSGWGVMSGWFYVLWFPFGIATVYLLMHLDSYLETKYGAAFDAYHKQLQTFLTRQPASTVSSVAVQPTIKQKPE
jgi:hypothetical protein